MKNICYQVYNNGIITRMMIVILLSAIGFHDQYHWQEYNEGSHFNIDLYIVPSFQYRGFHDKDTIIISLHNGNSFTVRQHFCKDNIVIRQSYILNGNSYAVRQHLCIETDLMLVFIFAMLMVCIKSKKTVITAQLYVEYLKTQYCAWLW